MIKKVNNTIFLSIVVPVFNEEKTITNVIPYLKLIRSTYVPYSKPKFTPCTKFSNTTCNLNLHF